MKSSTMKLSTKRVFSRLGLLLLFACLIFPLLLAATARPDERDDIVRDIESRLRDIRGYISQLAGASSASNVGYAIDKADSIKDKIRDLDRVKGDDSKASDMVSKYPGYVDKFKEAMQYLKQIKEQHLALRESDQIRKCKDAEERIQSKIADYRQKAPKDRYPKALRGEAHSIASTVWDFVRRMKDVPDPLGPLASKVNEFNVTDGEWRDVSSAMSSSAEEIRRTWVQDVADAREICNKVALGATHPDVLKAAYGSCEEEKATRLQEVVDRICKDEEGRSCDGDQLCPQVRENLRKNKECYDARLTIMKECFNGGDAGHVEQLDGTERAINKCNDRLKDCKENN
ncbi:MAG: hypothetical protein QOH63_323 [Acidobacteriota bacterium]|jgi:hypothetical protein|nr:hypothetical protein [Acidobacteriota bacterium]